MSFVDKQTGFSSWNCSIEWVRNWKQGVSVDGNASVMHRKILRMHLMKLAMRSSECAGL